MHDTVFNAIGAAVGGFVGSLSIVIFQVRAVARKEANDAITLRVKPSALRSEAA